MTKIEAAKKYRDDIIKLLTMEKLPVADLPELLDDFIVATNNDKVRGVAGIETYDEYGLLRSLAVNKMYRNQGIANNLLREIELIGLKKQLKTIYLLTETAPEYFFAKGFQKIHRNEVPASVLRSSEFSHVCPQSAIVMKKDLTSL